MSNHQGGVIVSSNTYLTLVAEGLWDIWIRIEMLLGAFFSWLPSSLNPFPSVYVQIFVRDFAIIPGSGGFPFVYLYIWGGPLLLILGSFYLAKLITQRNLDSRFKYATYLLVWATFPRWFAYSLPTLIKFYLLMLALIAIYLLLKKGLNWHF
jgi:hypothetical protein